MRFKKAITILVLIITVLSTIAALVGVFSNNASEISEFKSIHGEQVEIYGKGIYKNDSIAIVAQGRAQDVVTLVLGIPILLISLGMYRKKSLKGKLLLTGTLAFFLYTYVSYTFLWMYNSFFLIYVIIMSASFFAFTLCMMSFDLDQLRNSFNTKLPIKTLAIFQIVIGLFLAFNWLGMILPAVINNSVPLIIEHYTALVIQGLDLGFIFPISILSAVLLLKRNPYGYLLSSIVIIKGITLGTSVTAMVIGQLLAGVKLNIAEIVMFPLLSIGTIYLFFILLNNISEPLQKNI